MSRPVDVLAVIDRAHVAFSGDQAAEIYAARAAVAELLEAARDVADTNTSGAWWAVSPERREALKAKYQPPEGVMPTKAARAALFDALAKFGGAA